jgi:hypothetical protein
MEKNKKSKKEEFEVELVDKFDKEELFDDCPVCQAMKAAQEQGEELTLEKLKEAFKKAKGRGAIVGGEWFEKSKK